MQEQIENNYATFNSNFALDFQKPISKFIFHTGNTNNDWLLEITENGFKFNHDAFPNANADAFAKAFIEIMERLYTVKFEKREYKE